MIGLIGINLWGESMEHNIRKENWIIKGMTCLNCENKIYKALLQEEGVYHAKVSYGEGNVEVEFDSGLIDETRIIQLIEDLDYEVVDEDEMDHQSLKKNTGWMKLIGVMIILIAIYVITQTIGAMGLLKQIPFAKEGMGYGMLFVIGLLTSVHCVGMCGGICLSQCLSYKTNHGENMGRFHAIRPSFLYNLGRVISYTMVGGIVGGLGAVVSFTGSLKGIVQIVAGIFMVIMGLNMMNVFPKLRKLMPGLPKGLTNYVHNSSNGNGPFYVGLANGFMPCGPLQAMQLYALSTGSIISGALSMLVFSIGTVPLMFGLGTLSALLSKKFTKRVMTIGAAFVVVLGVVMFQNGAVLSGIPIPSLYGQILGNKDTSVAKRYQDHQEVVIDLKSGSYDSITVYKGIPTKWNIRATRETLNGCNDAIVIPKYGIEKVLVEGDNIIEFTPTETGIVSYSCWMGMIYSTINVIE